MDFEDLLNAIFLPIAFLILTNIFFILFALNEFESIFILIGLILPVLAGQFIINGGGNLKDCMYGGIFYSLVVIAILCLLILFFFTSKEGFVLNYVPGLEGLLIFVNFFPDLSSNFVGFISIFIVPFLTNSLLVIFGGLLASKFRIK